MMTDANASAPLTLPAAATLRRTALAGLFALTAAVLAAVGFDLLNGHAAGAALFLPAVLLLLALSAEAVGTALSHLRGLARPAHGVDNGTPEAPPALT